MEPQTQQPTEDGGSNKAAGSSANRLCRKSSPRWTPTTDQIRILKELYCNKGVRSPTAEQIQRTCLHLRWYGSVESKNVYYWFGNQRAREKQKKFTSDVHVPMQRSGLVSNGNGTNWKPEDQYINFGSSAPTSVSSAGVMIAFNRQIGNCDCYGSMNTEVETLPLFPMHGEDIFGNMKTTSEGGGGYSGGSRISLELSLNSYGSTQFSREGVFSAREETEL